MARNKSTLTQWAEYLPLRALAGLVSCSPMEFNMYTSKCIGDIFYHMSSKRRERALGNIRMCFPYLSEQEALDLVKKSIEHMFQLFIAEGVKMPLVITPSTHQQYITFKGLEKVTERLEQNKPIIFITGHCGNWELLGYALSVLGYPIAAVARPLDNALLNDWVLGVREKYGLQVITKWGGVPVIQDLLRQNTSIGFIADQNAGGRGIYVPFFDRLASTYKSIGLLAMRHNVPIVAVHAKRTSNTFQYEVTVQDFIEPSEWENQPDPLFYITARYSRAIEQMVRSAPEQYLWLHRRWKSRPQFELDGEPMPKKLQKQLKSLPWMTDSKLAKLSDVTIQP
jgi:Kdo2-lipid IVA lauroyltransferase/acyltransferase